MSAFILASFTTLFVTVNPIKGAAVFAVISKDRSRPQQRRIAMRATLIASGILLIFALFGDDLLRGQLRIRRRQRVDRGRHQEARRDARHECGV